MSAVGQRIRAERIKRNLSQYRLAQLSGVSQSTINAIEAEGQTRSPAVDTVEKLARALGCDVHVLMGEKNIAVENYTPQELRLLSIVRRLNSQGVEKVIDYASDLADNEKYTQEASASSAV